MILLQNRNTPLSTPVVGNSPRAQKMYPQIHNQRVLSFPTIYSTKGSLQCPDVAYFRALVPWLVIKLCKWSLQKYNYAADWPHNNNGSCEILHQLAQWRPPRCYTGIVNSNLPSGKSLVEILVNLWLRQLLQLRVIFTIEVDVSTFVVEFFYTCGWFLQNEKFLHSRL